MITPETTDVNEYEAFIVSFTIEPTDPLLPPTLESVSVAASDGKDYSSELTITIQGDLSFIVSGTLSDVFNREMEYLDKNDKSGMVHRFKDIPSDFNTLYRYKGAVVNSVDLTVTAHTDLGDEVATIVVNNNYNVANANLVKYVALGKF